MSMDHDGDLRRKLQQLECHFTWGLVKDELDLPSVLNRMEETLKLDFGKKDRLARIHSALAYIKYLQGCHEEALRILMTSVQLYIECHKEENHNSLIVNYGNLAWLNYHMKNYTECKRYLKKLEKIHENMSSETSSVPEVFGEKGWILLKFSHKYYERAKECFKEALELKPEDSEWNAGYAVALHRTENQKFTINNSPAIKQLRRAIEINPDEDVLKVFLALRLSKYQGVEEDKRLVEEALQKSPDHPHVLRYAGKYFSIIGYVDRGIDLLSKALKLSPNSSVIHHQLAISYNKKQQLLERNPQARQSEVPRISDQIIYHLEMAITYAPCFILALRDQAMHYGKHLDNSRAEELFQALFKKAEEQNDHLDMVNFYYAEFQIESKGRVDLAIKHYMECLKMKSSYLNRKCELRLSNIAKWRIKINMQDGEAHGILGFIHKERGETRQAIECYEKALSYVDNDEYLANLCDLRLSLQESQ